MTSTTLFAPTLAAAAGASPASGGGLFFIVQMVLVFAIFWLLILRPQRNRLKAHQAQIAAVKKGDRVVTGGGLIGKVVKVADNEVEVELGQGLKVTAVKSTLAEVINPTATKPAND
ncbi:preprotein translocase subunit YajC [Sphingomonas rhizophila]|uniref:Sec translocon accessory complex subunit YajC n=1 Tax=Sphingomonas rhizophila TaxID=2071607 RepID=A0A7G9S9Q7_9SPHN|nr:preprotein translocase subunit YajC [Sphingomonas rhizophila]QNN64582.1 preprotein translocase subunit YajC [Sphingomonas rhizophila]